MRPSYVATALAVGTMALAHQAQAHGFAGDHMFISTLLIDDPNVADEALIPGNKQAGSHLGVIAQFHPYIDDVFPTSLGKPIVDWYRS